MVVMYGNRENERSSISSGSVLADGMNNELQETTSLFCTFPGAHLSRIEELRLILWHEEPGEMNNKNPSRSGKKSALQTTYFHVK